MNNYHHPQQPHHQPGFATTAAAPAHPKQQPRFPAVITTATNHSNVAVIGAPPPPNLLHLQPAQPIGGPPPFGIVAAAQFVPPPTAFCHEQNQQRHFTLMGPPANNLLAQQHRPPMLETRTPIAAGTVQNRMMMMMRSAAQQAPHRAGGPMSAAPVAHHLQSSTTFMMPENIAAHQAYNLGSSPAYLIPSMPMENAVPQASAAAPPAFIAPAAYQQQQQQQFTLPQYHPCAPPPPIIFNNNNHMPSLPPLQFPPPSPSAGIGTSAMMAAAAASAPVLAPPTAQIVGGSGGNGQSTAAAALVENGGVVGPGDCWSTAVTGWEQAALIKNKIGLIINARFRILQSIASGSYGEIFAAEDLHSFGGMKRARVAVKFDGACRDNHLRYEYQVYKSALYEDGNGKVDGFPQVFWYGHEYGHNIMVMELLGAPVASLFAFCDRKFARQTIVSLGEQMIQRIRHLHQRGFIHRDIKPENFLMGLAGCESTLYLIDFGLARRYRYREGENRALTHIPYRRGRSFIGTAKYASLNSHKNIELSRRDDLESLAYVLIELVNGHLPWKNIHKRNATTRHLASQRIRQLKEQTNWDEFCPCLAEFMRYCREIPFNEEPDYDKLLDLLQPIALPEHPTVALACRQDCATVTNPTKSSSKHYHVKQQQTICCQTTETVEKMIQVDMAQNDADENNGDKERDEDERNISCVTKFVVASIQRQLSLNVGETPSSDIDEIGAATTTTSCSENEMDSGGAGCVTTRSGTGTADDEDSQPTPQQEQQQQQQQQQICRKCRRLRDQNNQKRVMKEQEKQQRSPGEQQQQQTSGNSNRVDMGLQTDFVLLEHHHQQKQSLPMEKQQQQQSRKMCWQSARESNAERRFQYENKFSWTLPLQNDPQQMAQPVEYSNQINAAAVPAAAQAYLPLLSSTQMWQTNAAAAFPPPPSATMLATNMPIQQQQQLLQQQHQQYISPPPPFAAPPTIGCCIPPPGMGMAQQQQQLGGRSAATFGDVSPPQQQQFLFTAVPPPVPVMQMPEIKAAAAVNQQHNTTFPHQHQEYGHLPPPAPTRPHLQVPLVFPPPSGTIPQVAANVRRRHY